MAFSPMNSANGSVPSPVFAHPAARGRDDQEDGPNHADEHRQPEELRFSSRRLEDPEVAEVRDEKSLSTEPFGERSDELARSMFPVSPRKINIPASVTMNAGIPP